MARGFGASNPQNTPRAVVTLKPPVPNGKKMSERVNGPKTPFFARFGQIGAVKTGKRANFFQRKRHAGRKPERRKSRSAERAAPMGNSNSTRWKGHQKKTRADECQRITAREARHIGAPTITEPVANSAARRLWCLCPDCEKRALHLYRLPSGGAWKCRKCHRLTDAKAQEKGTRAAFGRWLTRERWAKMSRKHPATARTYEAIGAFRIENVAPYDWEQLDPNARAELLKFYASEDAVKSVFDAQRGKWAVYIEEQARATSEEIGADLWKWWKHHNRSKARAKRELCEVPTS